MLGSFHPGASGLGTRRVLVAATCLAALAGAPSDAGAQSIGSVDRIVETANRQPPGQQKILATEGDELVQDELLETLAASSMHVVFVDGTDLTLEGDSQLILDTYVYNPDAGAGQAVFGFATGTLRYVSGQIGKGAIIDTPIATIGIRGTAFTCTLEPGAAGLELTCEVTEGSIEVDPKGEGRSAVASAGQIIILISPNSDPTVLGQEEPGAGGIPPGPQITPPPLGNPAQDDPSPI